MMDVLKAAAATRRRHVTKKLAASVHRAALDVLLQEIQEIEDRAHRLGVHVTGRALNRAKNALGWEIAGETDKAAKAASRLK